MNRLVKEFADGGRWMVRWRHSPPYLEWSTQVSLPFTLVKRVTPWKRKPPGSLPLDALKGLALGAWSHLYLTCSKAPEGSGQSYTSVKYKGTGTQVLYRHL